jgi:hypothetical protein
MPRLLGLDTPLETYCFCRFQCLRSNGFSGFTNKFIPAYLDTFQSHS